jgi:hypothetical protein
LSLPSHHQDRDRKVKVFSDGVAVSDSTAQSQYAKYLNFIGFNVTENDELKAYDVAAVDTVVTDEKVALYHNAVQVGTVARKLNLSTDFTATEDAANNRFNIGMATAAGSILLPDGTTTTKPKVGTFYGGTSQGNGLLTGLTVNGTPTVELGTTDMYTVFTSGATDALLGGVSTPFPITRRSYNPTFKIRFKPNLATERVFISLNSDATQQVNSDTPLNSKTGVGIMYSDSIANSTATWNNGAGTAQTLRTGVARDAAVHTLTVTWVDTPTASVTINFDGTNVVNASTTAVPATGTSLYVHANMEAIGATASPLAINYAYIVQDK